MLSVQDYIGPLKIESEAYLAELRLAHRTPQSSLVFCVEHQEAAATGADEFPAQGTVLHRQVVPAVDLGVTHRPRALFLEFPVDFHEVGELRQVAGLQGVLAL